MNCNCEIIDDLLPLYLDGACSKESKAVIETHLTACNMCRDKLARMKADTVIPELIPSNCELSMAKYARKVKRHRIGLAIGVVVISIAVACILSLVFLTIRDMRIKANPQVHPVEAGVYDLTVNPLEVTAAAVDEYIFYTNNEQISVSIDQSSEYSGEVLLWNVDDRTDPCVILYGKITSDERSCIFTGLSSSCRYMITCDGKEDITLTVSDGRIVSFFESMKNVLNDVLYIIIGS